MTTEEEKQQEAEGEGGGSQASRARNRTVMLTPEITGEVRARLAQDMASETPKPAEPARSTPAASPKVADTGAGGGFHSPASVQTPPPSAAPAAPQQNAMGSPAPASSGHTGVIWSKRSKVAGFLVSYDEDENGEVFELRMGRLIVTSEPPGAGNYLVLNDDTVSSMHAIIRISSFGEIQILDQLSEFGTRIIRGDSGKEEDLSGDKSVLHHGDVVFFGERKFSVCLIPVDEDDE